jgi:hypothetical protein
MTLLLVIVAITFILVGAVLLWNPLNRRQGRAASLAPGSGIAHDAVSV